METLYWLVKCGSLFYVTESDDRAARALKGWGPTATIEAANKADIDAYGLAQLQAKARNR